MKQVRCLLLLIFSFSFVKYGVSQITFLKTYTRDLNATGKAVQQTTDGGYVLAGYCNSPDTTQTTNILVIKTNAEGDTLWMRSFDKYFGCCSPSGDNASSVVPTPDGGCIVAGTIKGQEGYGDALLMKLDTGGNIVWQKRYGLGYGAHESFSYVASTSDGNFVAVGQIIDATLVNGGIYLVKVDKNGNMIWSKMNMNDKSGGKVSQTSDGGYIVADLSGSVIYRADASGNFLWSKGVNNTPTLTTKDVVQMDDGNYLISESKGVAKLSPSGALLWFGQLGPYWDIPFDIYDIEKTRDGGYVFCGYKSSWISGGVLFKTDNQFNIQWCKLYKGIGTTAVRQTADGGFIMTGGMNSSAFLLKTDSMGNSNCSDSSLSIAWQSATPTVSSPFIYPDYGGVENNASLTVFKGGIDSVICFLNIPVVDTTSEPPVEPVPGVDTTYFFTVYPNPAHNFFNLQFDSIVTDGYVKVFDALGAVVYDSKLYDELKKEVHLAKNAHGVYFLEVFDGLRYFYRRIVIY